MDIFDRPSPISGHRGNILEDSISQVTRRRGRHNRGNFVTLGKISTRDLGLHLLAWKIQRSFVSLQTDDWYYDGIPFGAGLFGGES